MIHESHHLSIGETLAVVNWRHIWLAWGALIFVAVAIDEREAMVVRRRVMTWLQGVAHVSFLDKASASSLVKRSAKAARCSSHHTLAGVWVASSCASLPLG